MHQIQKGQDRICNFSTIIVGGEATSCSSSAVQFSCPSFCCCLLARPIVFSVASGCFVFWMEMRVPLKYHLRLIIFVIKWAKIVFWNLEFGPPFVARYCSCIGSASVHQIRQGVGGRGSSGTGMSKTHSFKFVALSLIRMAVFEIGNV